MLKYVYWFILLLLATGTTWLLWRLDQDSRPVQTVLHIPDYTLQHFTTRKMNREGQLTYQLSAAHLHHFQQRHSQIDNPVLIFYEQQQPRWRVQAEKGEISPDALHIWLRGQATIEGYNAEQQRVLTIISRDIAVDIQQQTAETRHPVQMTHLHGKTESVGMRVLLQQQQLQLFSKVRGHYAK